VIKENNSSKINISYAKHVLKLI